MGNLKVQEMSLLKSVFERNEHSTFPKLRNNRDFNINIKIILIIILSIIEVCPLVGGGPATHNLVSSTCLSERINHWLLVYNLHPVRNSLSILSVDTEWLKYGGNAEKPVLSRTSLFWAEPVCSEQNQFGLRTLGPSGVLISRRPQRAHVTSRRTC